ncbi:MAG TPA: hypothetical protein DCL61_07200 [Cyanobacteria bacterium UBA12227]|nr:hypothetical protein [Cyanobacteria bacterium UBA12227]HAX86828.1 hypothetical protein [Cyanobacteria bacterium UBA11370]
MAILTVTNTANQGQGSLRAILAAAKAGDTIKFSSNLAQKTITLTSGQLVINKNLTLDGADAPGLKISGNNTSRVFFVSGVQPWIPLTVTLRNLSIINGKTVAVGDAGGGAGIWAENNTKLTIQNCQFRNNHANGTAGGAILTGWGATTTVINSKFDNNSCQGNDIGGKKSELAGGAITSRTGTLIVRNSRFTNNKGLNGGAINIRNSQTTIENSTFIRNDSSAGGAFAPHTMGYGGAVYTDGIGWNKPGVIRISNSRFERNKAAGHGGALLLWTYEGDKSIVENSTIINNQVIYNISKVSSGGGIQHGNGDLEIRNTTVAYNRAFQQGGGLTTDINYSTIIANSTFYGNRAESPDGKQGLGGGIMLNAGSAPATITKTTIAKNYAGWQGGGVWGNSSKVNLKDSLFSDNFAYNGGNNWNGTHHVGQSFINGGGNFQSSYPNPNDVKVTASAILTDPKLGVLTDNGSYLQTPPLPGNPIVTGGAMPIGGSGMPGNRSNNLGVIDVSPTDTELPGTDHSDNNTDSRTDRELPLAPPPKHINSPELIPISNTNAAKQPELLDLRDRLTGMVSAEFTVSSEAAYNNSGGFYVVDNYKGHIGNLKPSDPGYAQAAVSQRLDLDQELLPAGKLLAPFIIADGTPEEFLAHNPNNQHGQGKLAYFAYIGANPDGVDHVRQLDKNTFAFEDLFGGGDRDFNDLVITVNLA